MGRKRTKDFDLPPRMRRIGHAYYYDAGGKPRKWTPLGSDKPRAMLRWAELNNGVGDGRCVGDLIDRYLANCNGITDSTLTNYRRMSAIIRKYFGSAPIGEVRRGHIQEFHDRYPKQMQARNVTLMFRQMLKRAVQWEWIAHNPADDVEVRPQQHRDRYVTDAEFIAIRAQLPPVFQVAAELAYIIGLRVSDVVRLKFTDIKDGVIYIIQKKTRKPLHCELTPEIEDILERARQLKRPIRSFHVICTARGKPYNEKTVSRMIHEAAQALGISDVRFHDMRAKSASDEQETAQKRLGHRSASATLSYLRKPQVVTPLRRKL